MNRYAYVNNSPIKYVDPYGLEKVIILYGRYLDTTSFRDAAETQYQMALEAGYDPGDILLMEVSVDADVLGAIAGSDVNEIELLYILSHGWRSGLQLSPGDYARRQLEADDLGEVAIGLQDRFADDAEFHILGCEARGGIAWDIADAFDVTVHATALSMRFWKGQNWEPRRQVLDSTIFGWVDARPGELDDRYHRWVPYHGPSEPGGRSHVIMSPYLLGEVTVFGLTVDLAVRLPSAYGPLDVE